MFCGNCSKQIPDNIAFCPFCGASQSQQGHAYSTQPAPSVGFLEATKLYFTRYAEFSGRSRRSEYWWAYLSTAILGFLIAFFLSPVAWIWTLATFIPGLAICVRRLHDIGKSGWTLLLGLIPLVGPILLIVWYCTDSAPDNEWGPNPKVIRVPKYEAPVPAMPAADPVPMDIPANDPIVHAAPASPVVPANETMFIPPQLPTPPDPVYPVAPSTPSGVMIEIISGPMTGKRYTLSPGKTAIIGRNMQKSDIALPAYESVSGAHCQIVCYNDCVTITDLASTNGSFVNDTRLPPQKPIKINKSVVLRLANANCTIRIDMSRLQAF